MDGEAAWSGGGFPCRLKGGSMTRCGPSMRCQMAPCSTCATGRRSSGWTACCGSGPGSHLPGCIGAAIAAASPGARRRPSWPCQARTGWPSAPLTGRLASSCPTRSGRTCCTAAAPRLGPGAVRSSGPSCRPPGRTPMTRSCSSIPPPGPCSAGPRCASMTCAPIAWWRTPTGSSSVSTPCRATTTAAMFAGRGGMGSGSR
jgi:hypothetical protein